MNARFRLPRRVGRGMAALGLALAATPGWGRTALPGADLYLWIEDGGTAKGWLMVDVRPPAPAALAQAVGRVLGRGAAVGRPVVDRGGWDLPSPGVEERMWKLSAHGGEHFHRRGTVVEGQIDLAPLEQELRRMGEASLSVTLSHLASGLDRCTGAERREVGGGVVVEYSLVTPVAAAPRSIQLEFGYPPAALLRIFGPMALPFFLPVAMTLGLRRRALRDGIHDPAGAWFRYNRTLRWVLLGAFVGATTAEFTFPAEAFFRFALPALGEPYQGLLNCLGPLLPPLVAAVLCGILSHSVAQRLRGIESTRGEVVGQSVVSLATGLFGAVLAVVAIWKLDTDARSAGRWFLAACVSWGLGAWFIRRSAGTVPQPVTTGELHDRLFALAEQAGVKLREVTLLPARKGRMANAFAALGGQMVLTDYLLQHLTRREVDAVVAHELAHLKRRDPLRLLGAILLAVALPVALFIGLGFLFAARIDPFVFALPLAVACGIPALYLVSRRCERAADAGAIALTGDPEALITALAKITRLNTMPMHWGKWDERLITHPSTMRRAEAIAAQGGVPTERLQAILHDLDADTDRYTLPGSSAEEERVFSPAFKRRLLARNAWAYVVVVTLTPAAVAALARVGRLEGAAHGAVPLVALVVTFALTLLASSLVVDRASAELRRRLGARLEQEGVPVEAGRGAFVGFAPNACPRFYGGLLDWDVGFLFLDGDRLCYAGEATRFALRPEQVTGIRLGAGHPAWWRTWLVSVTWRDDTRGAGGTFSLRPADASSLWSERAVAPLARALQRWREQPAVPSALPAALVDLAAPALGGVTGDSPRMGVTGNIPGLIWHLVERVLFAMGAAFLFNLPFSPPDGGDGWWAVVVSVLVPVCHWVPYWRYREPEDAHPTQPSRA